MAANTDNLMKVGLASATTLDSNYTINDTTVTVASTSGWPSDTGIVFAIDVIDSQGVQVPGTYNEFVGTVATGTSISNVDWADGNADRDYTAGATTRVYIPVSKTRENRIVTWGLAEHNQDGTHEDITATTVTTSGAVLTSPKVITGINDTNGNELLKVTATASAVNELTLANAATGNDPSLTASGGDTNIGINLVPKGTGEVQIAGTPMSGAWQSWTPTFTNFTKGSATIDAKYKQIGKTVHFTLEITLSGSTMGTAPTYSLPVTAATRTNNMPIAPRATFLDFGTGSYSGISNYSTSTTGSIFYLDGNGNGQNLTSTVPFTWANNDVISLQGFYEAA